VRQTGAVGTISECPTAETAAVVGSAIPPDDAKQMRLSRPN